MHISDRTLAAIIAGAAGLTLILVVRFTLKGAFERFVRRAEARRAPDEVARLRTRLDVLRRAILAFLVVLVAWSVLEIFPTTQELARTLLASGAVLAVFVGLAFSVPLGNLGAGILLAVAQPVRLGDRISVGDVTGTADEITLIHTVLLTDDDRRIFVPNTQMVSSVVVNRTIQDPRRTLTATLPVGLNAPIDRARRAVLDAVRDLEHVEDLSVVLGEIGERTAWLTLTAYAPPRTQVGPLAGELR